MRGQQTVVAMTSKDLSANGFYNRSLILGSPGVAFGATYRARICGLLPPFILVNLLFRRSKRSLWA